MQHSHIKRHFTFYFFNSVALKKQNWTPNSEGGKTKLWNIIFSLELQFTTFFDNLQLGAKLKILRIFLKRWKKSQNSDKKVYNFITHNSEERFWIVRYKLIFTFFLSLDRKKASMDMGHETSTNVHGQFINKTVTAECCKWPIMIKYSREPHNKLLLLVGIFTSKILQ